MRYLTFVVQRLIVWTAGAVTACGLLIALGNQASAQDNLSLSVGGAPPFLELVLPETGAELVDGQFRGNTIDFFTPGYGVSDNVTFGPFNFTFSSDTETSPTLTPLPGAITRTIKGENAALALRLASDSDPTSPGGQSDRFELDLITSGNPDESLMSGTLTEAIGREIGRFDLPQIVISFEEGDGTISDILALGPVMIDITSDGEVPLPATGNLTITGESGTIFSITAASDIPEPASVGILAAALAGLVITRLVTGSRTRSTAWHPG